jgi:hypothetical protein
MAGTPYVGDRNVLITSLSNSTGQHEAEPDDEE